ncbi:MAG: aspartate-semialdehyde dehydrogenase [Candidatus Vidania fulgoroideorum]
MKNIGIIGVKGIVGKIIKNKIKNNKNWKIKYFEKEKYIKNKKNIYKIKTKKIRKCIIIINCKNEKFSKKIYEKLKKINWKGYYIDASSAFRMNKKSIICLDPLNKNKIKEFIKNKGRIFCGSNCTVSLTLISILKLIKKKIIKNILCNTYQAISGAGYKETNKLFRNNYKKLKEIFKKKKKKININKIKFKKNCFSIQAWIGKNRKTNSEEEKKGEKEINKILNLNKKNKIKVFSTCIRINVFRCHSINLIISLKKDMKIKKFKKIIKNKYIKIIKNNKMDTLKKLNPNIISEKNKIYIGRIRKVKKKMFSIFIVGDQLLWGAAIPLIRTAKIITKYINK